MERKTHLPITHQTHQPDPPTRPTNQPTSPTWNIHYRVGDRQLDLELSGSGAEVFNPAALQVMRSLVEQIHQPTESAFAYLDLHPRTSYPTPPALPPVPLPQLPESRSLPALPPAKDEVATVSSSYSVPTAPIANFPISTLPAALPSSVAVRGKNLKKWCVRFVAGVHLAAALTGLLLVAFNPELRNRVLGKDVAPAPPQTLSVPKPPPPPKK